MTLGTFATARILKALPRVELSRAVGRLCERPLPPTLSRLVTGAYCKAYRVDLADVEPAASPYPTFDAFFTRALREGARPVSPDVVVSPADGVLSATGPVDSGTRISVKGSFYDVGELIGDPTDARRYCGGSFAVIYLSPRDYHRVHSPVDGVMSRVRHVPGDLYPVNAIGERHVPQLLAKNKRVAIVVDTAGLGRVTVVMVGAMVVGRISVTGIADLASAQEDRELSPSPGVKRGDEIGIFHLGSTVVLFVEPQVTLCRPEGRIRYGQSLLAAS
ncbi:MAG: phosphatidylserine decarboxylase [Polyangiaceae bacterium]|nr:phosphatidylserine decarboxylase [Polyangiaceae bacterium]